MVWCGVKPSRPSQRRAVCYQSQEFAAANLTECGEADWNFALTRVSEHRSITEAYARRFPRTEVVELPEALHFVRTG